VIAVLVALALAAGYPAGPGDRSGRTVPEPIVGFTFVPGTVALETPGQPLRIRTGDTVEWVNLDAVSHDVTFDSLPFQAYLRHPGDTARYTFARSGYFTYHCHEHPEFPGMHGLVYVSDTSP
jgi:plastocyanin